MAGKEQFTETLVRSLMHFDNGQQSWGYVYPQGDGTESIRRVLKKCGGKPSICALEEYPEERTGIARPEYVITYSQDPETILVIECKANISAHESQLRDRPSGYAVDGVLYYAKYLKFAFNVIAVAVSGTSLNNYRASVFYWSKGAKTYSTPFENLRGSLVSPTEYLQQLKGIQLTTEAMVDLRNEAMMLHEYLRQCALSEKQKPLFIAGILIALQDSQFHEDYKAMPSTSALRASLKSAIGQTLNASNLKPDRIAFINRQVFDVIEENQKLKSRANDEDQSLMWFIKRLDAKIWPLMKHPNQSIDVLGEFYHEFIRYSGGDGSGLGIVLTPQHLTEFMARVSQLSAKDVVLDPCCGTGSFLVTAMSMMTKQATASEIEHIKQNQLYGFELQSELSTLAISNMIVRHDGKSNIYAGDCFSEEAATIMSRAKATIGLMNPPYSQEKKKIDADKTANEMKFVLRLLSMLQPGGRAAVVVPVACALGNKFKEERRQLLQNHTLDAVFSMPNDIFYPTATNICVMVWIAHRPHRANYKTFFGFCKDDGFEKRKKLGRIDVKHQWPEILNQWVDLYETREQKDGLSALHAVTTNDEWICEAYMDTNYSSLKERDFEIPVRHYLAHLVSRGIWSPNLDHKEHERVQLPDVSEWKSFKVKELFKVESRSTSKYPVARDYEPGDVPFVSSTYENNGVSMYVSAEPFVPAHTLSVARNGSVGSCFYHEEAYCISCDDVRVLVPRFSINKYSGIFFRTLFEMQKFKFSYGRKMGTKRMEEIVIRLPVDAAGQPDWDLMSRYIQSLPYADQI